MPIVLVLAEKGKRVADSNLGRYVDSVGSKAAGLMRLPESWRPEFAVVTQEVLEVERVADTLARDVLYNLPPSEKIIVRSSVSDEAIDARGRYVSTVVDANPADLGRCLLEVYTANRTIIAETPGNADKRCSLIVQPYLEAQAHGHLANEYRHAQRNVDFLYEADICEPRLGITVEDPHSFRLPRPLRRPRPTPLELRRFRNLPDALKHVASWLAASLGRGHAEWVLSGDRLWIVQFDAEQEPASIKPLEQWHEQAAGKFRGLLHVFRRLTGSGDFDRWRKSRSHLVAKNAGLPVPPLYILDDEPLIATMMAGRLSDDIKNDVQALLEMPAMIRLDVDSRITDWQNLPARGPLRSLKEAEAFILAAVAEAARRKVSAADLSIVVHHFLPSKASAWATARPNSSKVEIDAIWGLPDGLQALPYDTFFIDVAHNRLDKVIRYKDEFLDIDKSGRPVTRRSPPNLAQRSPLTQTSAREVAKGTLAIARVRQRPTSVMWFLLTDRRAGIGSSVPWICVNEEDTSDFWLDDAEHIELVERIRRKLNLGTVRRLRTPEDLAFFRQNPKEFDAGSKSVLFRPSAELLGDRARLRSFFKEVAATFSDASGWYLVLEGSVISHAPYQLRSLGAKRVLSLWDYNKPKRRTTVGKLVRDRIPERIKEHGESPVAVELQGHDLLSALRSKLVEEALEVFYARGEPATIEELADVLTVLRDYLHETGITWRQVEAAEDEKRKKRGGFRRGLYLATTSSELHGESAPLFPLHQKEAIRRLRYKAGVAASLVPPYRPELAQQEFSVSVGEQALHMTVRYHGAEIVVTVERPAEVEDPSQLSLFDNPRPKT